ncbi:MAG: aminotransferase class V-fold PLP-dependent enzyme [Ichthyobacteriaceae bacterium]|nr:aminotransferase class V-fold PLP-dependent enzyme [Ichthyobacteriaceae bacterium]
MSTSEKYFEKYRKGIIGENTKFTSPFGEKKIIYADWVASGRLYKPIEDKITKEFGPFVANTHTETSETGRLMTNSYHQAQNIIKNHVNANKNDVLISVGFGMTSAINKFQRILGLKFCGRDNKFCQGNENKPIVFVTHMEHHSNHTSWLTTIAEVVMIEPDEKTIVNLDDLEQKLIKYKDNKFKIGAFTAASNVTGVIPPYHKMAKLMHQHNGVCFVDFAMAAPYLDIDMHPKDPLEKLDAITFSPHKFLGGPGSSGVLIFDASLYNRKVPDNPGGGTVNWTNAWGEYSFIDDIEIREDGGTPGFLQTIRTALSIKLKEDIGVENIKEREEEILEYVFERFDKINGINILENNRRNRLGAISFYHDKIHYNFIVKVLSDMYGIQVRGGCACAGTYGHILLNVDYNESKRIAERIEKGDMSEKPGWVRLSIHPVMTDKDIKYIMDAIEEVTVKHDKFSKFYTYSPKTNEYTYNGEYKKLDYKSWFEL